MTIIKDFVKDGMNMECLNYVFITLIPKASSAIKISQFWPIAYMDVVYKIIRSSYQIG